MYECPTTENCIEANNTYLAAGCQALGDVTDGSFKFTCSCAPGLVLSDEDICGEPQGASFGMTLGKVASESSESFNAHQYKLILLRKPLPIDVTCVLLTRENTTVNSPVLGECTGININQCTIQCTSSVRCT